MNQKQAEDLLKKVLDSCPALSKSIVSVMPPDSSDVPSKGYQIHIKDPVPDEEALCCLRGVAEKYNVALRQKEKLLILYKPLTG